MAPRKKDNPKGKAKKADEPADNQVKSSQVIKSISANDLKSLLKHKRQAQDFAAETNGSLGEKIAAAVENKNLHRKAFSECAKIDRMIIKKGVEAAAEYYDVLQHYLDISGLMAKIEGVQRLPLGDDKEDPADEAPKEDGGTVVSIGTAARAVAEKAGVA